MAVALTTAEIFNRTLYTKMPQMLNTNVDLFNRATNNAIQMLSNDIQGAWEQSWARSLKDIVLYRDPTSTAPIAKASFEELMHNMVKIGFSTKEIEWTDSKFEYIRQNPEEAAFIIGQTLVREMLQNSVRMAIGAATTLLSADASVTTDKSAVGDGKMKFEYFIDATRPFGDQYNRIVTWVLSSQQMFDVWKEALKNENHLFDIGSIKVIRNPLGAPIIISDEIKDNTGKFTALGLTTGAITVGNMAKFRDNHNEINGLANIKNSYQAEWDQTLSIKNHKFDTSQTPAVTYAKLTQSANWTKLSSNPKEQLGVALITK